MPQRQPAGWYHITDPARWLVPHATQPADWCITTVPATEWPTGWYHITKQSACGHHRLTWSQTTGWPHAIESARWLAPHPGILVTPSHPPRRSSVTATRGATGPSVFGSLPDIARSGRPSRPPARTPVSIPLLRRLRRRLGRALLMHGSFGCLGCCDPRFLRRTLRPHYRAPAVAKCSPSRSCRRRRASVHGAYLVITTPGPNGSDVPGRRGPPAGDHRQCLPGSRSSALPLYTTGLSPVEPLLRRASGGIRHCRVAAQHALPSPATVCRPSHNACRRTRQCHPCGGSVGWRGLLPALHLRAPARCVAWPDSCAGR